MSRHHQDEDELDIRLPLLGGDSGERGWETGRDGEGRGLGPPSPAMSTMSAQSHEVKHILDIPPSSDRDIDTGADYSHIHIRPKPRLNDGGLLVRPPPPAYNHHRPDTSSNPPHFHHPHPHRFQGSVVSWNVQRFRSPPQTLSLEDVSGFELSRRKSWSPPLLRQNAGGACQGTQKGVRSCYSSATVDWETIPPGPGGANWSAYMHGPQQHGYWQGHSQGHPQVHHGQGPLEGHCGRGDMGENLPPRLAPVSGVPPEKLSRNLIRPIAFKPAYARPPLKLCQHCGEDALCCSCVGGQASQNTAHSASQYKTQSGSQAAPCQPFSGDPMGLRSPSVRSVDQSSVHSAGHCSYRSAGYGTGSEPVFLADDSPGVNVDYSPPHKASANSEVGGQTPSPSDSGVGELEAMLKEREAEIMTLRQVMDRNERAIFQVYEEKRSQWLLDMQRIREDYEQRLKATQLKAMQLEQALHSHRVQPPTDKTAHTQLDKTPDKQQERTLREKLHTHKEKTQQDKSSNGNYANLAKDDADINRNSGSLSDRESQDTDAGVAASGKASPSHNLPFSQAQAQSSPGGLGLSVQEEIALKNSEILSLRAQLSTLQSQISEKEQALAHSLAQVDMKEEELRRVQDQLDQLSGVDGVSICEEGTQTVMSGIAGDTSALPSRPAMMSEEEYTQSLEQQMDTLRQQLQATEAMVESERVQWLEEKNKVIRYQKQLQLNYVQMQQKNRTLEAEVEQLTLELESRHLKLAAMNGEESVC